MNTRVQDVWCPWCEISQPMTHEHCQKCKQELTLIDRRYRLLRGLDKGGNGALYLAYDTRKQQEVVLKVVLPKAIAQNPNASARFEREIRITRLLSDCSHHAVQWHGAGKAPMFGAYMAIEYLQGQTLRALLHKQPQAARQSAFHIFFQLCDILADAHILGIVHRDLKPSNIFLIEQSGDPYFVKLLDFGLAKTLTETQHPGLTKGMLGTPLYMAPEQAVMAKVDERADIYALGLIVYEMLLGAPAFYDTDLKRVLMAHANQMPDPFVHRRPDLTFPQGLQETLFKAIQKKPKDRYDSILEFAQRMAEYDPCDRERWAHLTTPALSPTPTERFATILDSSEHATPSNASHPHDTTHKHAHNTKASHNNAQTHSTALPHHAQPAMSAYDETVELLAPATSVESSLQHEDTQRITFWLGLLIGLLCTMIVLVLCSGT